MSKTVKIKKGADIKLVGKAEKIYADYTPAFESVSIKPTDFHGVIPKVLAKPGTKVKAGTPLFYDKDNPKVKFCSPVSGEVSEIVRGEKRRILEFRIKVDGKNEYETFSVGDLSNLTGEQIKEIMLERGLWPFVIQRPFDVIANPDDEPKAIFISAFDSNPLAPDNDFILHGQAELFQLGIDLIAKLTKGKVHLNVSGNQKPDDVFLNTKNVQINKIYGPHPAGNVGVQIHHIDPINKGDIVWTLKPQDILTIARTFKEGKLDLSRVIAVCGSGIKKPRYYKTIAGVPVSEFLKDNLKTDREYRVVSGNPLTGEKVAEDNYLGFYHYQLTVIPEGNHYQFLGWLAPNFNKFSLNRTFFSWLMPNKEYDLDTNMNGEERAFVVTGEYEKVFPFDIYPVHLVKAAIIQDIEALENLGIYEVAPEDYALCEFACTSKIPSQKIIREGLDLVKKECA
ncbi:MAG TPA: NADH:ubiquinone reductase (Na(+)-transporting) subunit A [Flavobacteriales bacterium]|nr:NADH:ubiquinone reductase (Na(+)-transporting) subunit A [Flavobacteriales bacterium]|tara:strand:- start:57679 stop:59037 length:1359 start_codon:yes stop_codon:yes gene_type:complete